MLWYMGRLRGIEFEMLIMGSVVYYIWVRGSRGVGCMIGDIVFIWEWVVIYYGRFDWKRWYYIVDCILFGILCIIW